MLVTGLLVYEQVNLGKAEEWILCSVSPWINVVLESIPAFPMSCL